MEGLIIDCFAGGGGASVGIEDAFGRSPDIAINHDPQAVAMHAANHPNTKHYCQNIWQVDPQDAVKAAGGGPVAFAWFSPDCKHFSKAKGAAPVKRNIRDLAWTVVHWAERTRPMVIMLENVEEFRSWGPICHVTNQPIKAQAGETFDDWVKALRRLGYKVEWKELRASDFGAPTIRKRLYMVARRDGKPIVWPKPTHGKGLLPYRTAAECIDWSIPCPSIFERKKPLAENTQRRIARGLKKFVIDANDPFIVPGGHGGGQVTPYIARIGQTGGNGGYAYDIEKPLTTVTSKAEHLLIAPHLSRQFGQGTGRRVDEAAPTVTADGGGKSALVHAYLAKHFTGVTGVEVEKPMPTILASGSQTQLVTSHMMKMRGTNTGHAMDEPLYTLTGGGNHFSEVRAFLMKYYGNGDNAQDVREPIHTLSTKDRFGLVTIHGEDYAITDIGMRMLSARELFRAQGFDEEYIIDPEYNGKPLTKTAQVRCCGNSVCRDVAGALIKANTQQAERIAA